MSFETIACGVVLQFKKYDYIKVMLILCTNRAGFQLIVESIFAFALFLLLLFFFFFFTAFCDWSEKWRHFLNQWEAKPKPIVTSSHAFSRDLLWKRYLVRILIDSIGCLRLL